MQIDEAIEALAPGAEAILALREQVDEIRRMDRRRDELRQAADVEVDRKNAAVAAAERADLDRQKAIEEKGVAEKGIVEARQERERIITQAKAEAQTAYDDVFISKKDQLDNVESQIANRRDVIQTLEHEIATKRSELNRLQNDYAEFQKRVGRPA